MLGLAIVSYRWIETPLRKGNWFGKRWKTLVVGGGVLVTLSGGLIALGKPLKGKFYLGVNDCEPFQYETCTGIDKPHTSTTPFIRNTPIQREQCFLYNGTITESIIKNCSVPPKSANLPNVFTIGSSYVHHFSPAFENLHSNIGTGIAMSVVTSCDFDPLSKKRNKQITCESSNEVRTRDLIKNANPGDILFTGPTGLSVDKNSVKAIAEIGRTQKINIIYFTPIPRWQRLDDSVNDGCYHPKQWFNKTSDIHLKCAQYSEIDRKIHETKVADTLKFLSKIEDSNSYFHVYHIENLLCGELKCPSHIDGIILYRDNTGHLGIHAVQHFISENLKSFILEKKLLSSNN